MKSKIKKRLRNTFLAVMLLIGHIFPNSGIIKECDSDYESNDDIQMFI